MSKQGIYKITGNTKPKIGELVTYTIDEWYPATPLEKRNPVHVTWHLFKKVNGKFVPTNIKKVGVSSFTFNTNSYKDTFRIEAYLHNPEGRAPMALEIQPQPSDIPRINKVELKYIDDTPGTVFSFMEKLVAEAKCTNLEAQYLQFSLWEDDASNSGHSNNNLLIESKKEKVKNGIARAEFMLTKALMRKAMQGETDPQQLEFYVTVEYYSHKKHATNNININTPEELRAPSGQPQPQPQPQQPQPQPSQPQQPQPAPSPAQPEPDPQSAHGSAHNTQPPTPAAPGGASPTTVNPTNIEDLLDAYFAKKEYIKETGEEDGTHTYTFGGSKSGNKTGTAEEKNKVAQTILNKIKESLKAQKKYTTLEVIAAALTAEAYGKDTTNQKTVTFKTFKLGVDFKKVGTAPLDEKLYLVARTMLLDGQQVTISIKEKDGIIKGSPDALLPVLEITEAQMEQKTPAGQAVPGTEKTVFTGIVKNNIVQIPIHLRPKSEEELKQWQDKISKGKEDGTYTYTFGGANNITNETQKASTAKVILENAQKGNAKNPKIENGKTSSEEEIKKVLVIKNYQAGDTITFKLLKKVPEFLYLHAKAQGQKQHDKKFLNKVGAYFEIGGGKCSCNRDLTINEFKEILKHLRESEKLEINNIWNPQYTSGASPSDTSIASTLDQLNKIMKKYEINSCIRKVYFIAECYHETDRLRSTKEYNNSHTSAYDPYRGRGIIQLTHKEAYERYSFYRNQNTLVTNPDELAKNLDLAFDSAGWYFKQGKLLSVGNSWSPNGTDRQKYNLSNRSYPKSNYDTKFTNTDGSIVKRYGSIDLNLVADNDDIVVISYLINGGNKGLEERKKYVTELKKVPVFICDKNKTQPSSGDWHDPVDHPMSTNFYQNGNFDGTSKIWGLFGDDIRREVSRKHTGLDLFAERGKPIYACVDGTVYNRRWHSGYGNTITIKVKDPQAFMARKRTDYTRKTTREMEKGAGWSESGDLFLFYAHLHSVKDFTFGQEVKCGQQLGTTGRSGVTGGTCAPHLHFEIFCRYAMGSGTSYRINPAYFVNYKFYDEQSESERNAQTNEKNKGKINEVNGAGKLNETNLN